MADKKEELKNLWETLGIQNVKGHKEKIVVKMIVDKDSVFKGSKVYTAKSGKEYTSVYVNAHVIATEYVDYRGGKNKGVKAKVLEMPDQVRDEIKELAGKVKGMFVSDFTKTKDGNPSKVVLTSFGFNILKDELDKATDEGLARRAMGLAKSKIEKDIIPAFREMVSSKNKGSKENEGKDIETVVEEINEDER